MKIYLNAGFGRPLGIDLRAIRSLGFDGVRQDVPPGEEYWLLNEFAPGQFGDGLRPIFLINGGKMDEDPNRAAERVMQVALMMHDMGIQGEIEVGNEPDIAVHPKEMALFIDAAFNAVDRDSRTRDTKLITGGISSTSKRALDYLSTMLEGAPLEVAVGYHTYRTTTAPSVPKKGFSSREEEFDALRNIVGVREIWNTEIGWHTAKSKINCWKSVRFTDNEVFAFLKEELEYNREGCAVATTIYQLNDGPTNTSEDRFGIRHGNGAWKPQANIARR